MDVILLSHQNWLFSQQNVQRFKENWFPAGPPGGTVPGGTVEGGEYLKTL